MASSQKLTGLTPREAVADAVYRCIHGIDTNNRELFESSFLKDENTTFVFGQNTIKGWTAVNEYLSKVLPLVTTHHITNVRVELEAGADTASLTAHALAIHMRPEDAFKPQDISFTGGAIYVIDLVKDGADGLWKFKRWEIKIHWSTGDPGIIG